MNIYTFQKPPHYVVSSRGLMIFCCLFFLFFFFFIPSFFTFCFYFWVSNSSVSEECLQGEGITQIWLCQQKAVQHGVLHELRGSSTISFFFFFMKIDSCFKQSILTKDHKFLLTAPYPALPPRSTAPQLLFSKEQVSKR